VKILVVEDEPGARKALAEFLGELGHETLEAGTVAEAQSILRGSASVEACLVDLGLPDGDGLDIVREARALPNEVSVLVLTGQGSVRTAVEAMKAGAHDFLLKPLKPTQLIACLAHLTVREAPPRPAAGERTADRETTLAAASEMVGSSPAMQEVLRLLSRVARSDAPVMITGESGTGKEVAARTLHLLSRRAARPFVAVNCGAISPTLIESELFGHEKGSFTGAEKRRAGTFELAQGGTLFLDEITEMSPGLQVKLLRVLETRSFRRVGGADELDVDVRIVASSNRDLAEAVRTEAFRSDLFYRLAVFPIRLPLLKERREDVPALARHFLSRIEAKERAGILDYEDGALAAFTRYDWPGNVRELRNAVHRAYVLSDPPAISAEAAEAVLDGGGAHVVAAAPPAVDGEWPAVPVRVGEKLEAVERKLVEATLRAVNGDKRTAAELLGLSLKTIYNKLKQWGG